MKTVSIGRDPNNDVVIDDNATSRRHLEISRDAQGNTYIEDLNSSNGTFVNGHRINGRVALESNAIVRVGNTVLPWRNYFKENATTTQAPAAAPPVTPPPPVAAPAAPPVAPAPPPAQVVYQVSNTTTETPVGTSGMAIAGMILGILGIIIFSPLFGLLAIIFSSVGLAKTKDGKKKGRGMAVTGLIFGILDMIKCLVLLGLGLSGLLRF